MSSRSLARILCLAAAVASPFLRHQREARAFSRRCSCEERIWAFFMTHCENRGWSSYSPEFAKRCRLEEEVLLFLGQTREDLELEELVEAGIGTRQIGDSLFE